MSQVNILCLVGLTTVLFCGVTKPMSINQETEILPPIQAPLAGLTEFPIPAAEDATVPHIEPAASNNTGTDIIDLGDEDQIRKWQMKRALDVAADGIAKFSTLNCYCGREQGGGRIIGGSVVPRQGFYPWIVRLSVGCGATLVSDRWIVTAAHCITGISSPSALTIQFRQYQLQGYDPGEFSRTAKTIAYYKTLYNPSSLNYDFALVELSSPVSITGASGIRPACVQSQGYDYNGQWGIAHGWGVYIQGNGAQAPILRNTYVNIINNAACRARVGPAATHICGATSGRGICYGDSGGPLTVKNGNGAHYLAGIVSGSYGNRNTATCNVNLPQLYTQATIFTSVIQQYCFSNANICSP